jgi:5-methylcytosine-specific restriction endonuclease McrA
VLPPEEPQLFLFRDDPVQVERWQADQQEKRDREIYNAARRDAWYAGSPFPEDARKWYAFVNDCPRPNSRARERVRAEYREWYSQHSEWRKHATQSLRARKLGVRVGRRDAILKIYSRARSEGLIPCHWCKRMTAAEDREVDHIVPLTRGGGHTARNLCISCSKCNQDKRDLMPQEFMERIKATRKANALLLRRGQQNQLQFEFEPQHPGRRGPKKATQLTLVKIPTPSVA